MLVDLVAKGVDLHARHPIKAKLHAYDREDGVWFDEGGDAIGEENVGVSGVVAVTGEVSGQGKQAWRCSRS